MHRVNPTLVGAWIIVNLRGYSGNAQGRGGILLLWDRTRGRLA
jgi:hypothetical protein